MRQITTPSGLPNARRNAIVAAAGIQCHAKDCNRNANRWSNLCGQCEVSYLQYLKPVFGKPTPDQCKKAQAVIKAHYDRELGNGVFDDWVSQLSRQFSRPIEKLQPPLALKGYRTPKERFHYHAHHSCPCQEGLYDQHVGPQVHGQGRLQSDNPPLPKQTREDGDYKVRS